MFTDSDSWYVECTLPRKLRHYLDYVENRSFTLDLAILGRTVARVFRR